MPKAVPSSEAAFFALLKSVGIERPLKELRFDVQGGRRWRFDYAWPAHMVAIEVQGGAFMRKGGGRHTRGAGFRGDTHKFAEATAQGWRVLPVVPEELIGGEFLDRLERAMAHR